MKALVKLITHPVLLAIIGLAAISALIWFIGPMIAIAQWRPLESELVRLIAIALIILLYALKQLWKYLKARQANARMMEGLLRAAPTRAEPSASAEEVAALNRRFEEAIAILKQVRLSAGGRKPGMGDLVSLTGRQYLYQLPWYIFIGAPGSGKTTALINSGLQFPLAERFGTDSIRGVGGTRNCDWWFTDEAVLLDTAGRYTTQESHREVDSAAWNGFLQLLKKFRPRRPINGIILTVSASDLLQHTADERDKHAAALRARIKELHDQFNIRFPIYVLVTKCDLLAGFMEFFGELGKDERSQVWGMSFPLRGDKEMRAPLADFATEYDLLERRLIERVLDRMQQERDPQKRSLLFSFPQQFAAIKPLLSGLLERVFVSSKYEESPMVRGIYFTSGTQEGSPIDRVMGTLARAFGMERKMLPPHAASGRSYFLTRLLREVVFHEQNLAGTNLRWERRRTFLRLGGYVVAGLVALVAGAAWYASYSRNSAYIAEVSKKAMAIKAQVEALQTASSTDVSGLLPVLSSVQELAVTSEVPGEGVPWAMGFGLFQGRKLAAASSSAYQRLLHDAFLPRLAYRVEEQLRGSSRDNLEFAYEALKAYLMLHDTEHFDAPTVKAWITADWERNLPRQVTLEQRKQLETHLDTLLARGGTASPVPADANLVQQVRTMLAQYPLPQRVYSRLKREGVGAEIPEFRIINAAGPAAPLVFERTSGESLNKGIAGLFTYNGYHRAFVKEAERVTRQLAEEEGWVLGASDTDRLARFTDPVSVQRLTEDVRRLYLQDYAKVWETLVADIRLKRPATLQESIQTARILSAPDSPLPALLRAVSRETTLSHKPEGEKSALDKTKEQVESRLKEGRDALAKILGGDAQAAPASAGVALESIVDERFDNIRRLVTGPAPGQPAPIDAAVALINEVYTHLNATETAVKGGNAPPQSDVSNKVKGEAARMPEPVRSMLQMLSATAANQALRETKETISKGIVSSIGDFCRQAISGRYPFHRGSNRDVTQDDFARMFSPGGLMDEFFQKNLAQYVDTSTRPWSFKQVGEASMGSGSASLPQFQRAAVIRDVFFRGGGKGAALRLEFKPLEMDASISQFILDVDGQLVKYSHGPQVPATVQWPGPRGSTQVRLQLTPPSSAGASGLVFEGPWALFRMFDGVQMDGTGQPERFRVTFNIEGRRATFEVLASSVQNPFRLREIEQFQCPGQL